MNILLIGASGMIGSRILNEAVARGHSITAAARSPEKIVATESVTAITLDVNDSQAVARHANNADVIISAVSPRNTGDASQDAATFTAALIAAQQESGKRLLMVGGAGSLQLPDGSNMLDVLPDFVRPEATAMRSAYHSMVSADIDFTVLAPAGMIEPGERTGEFRLGGRTALVGASGGGNISAEDYAIAMLDEVETPQHFRTVFNVAY